MQTGDETLRQTNGKVTQMSHGWIEKRLPSALIRAPADLDILRKKKRLGYSRHVLFFSIPHAAAHAEALILHTAQQRVDVSMHAAHQATREWGDNQLEKEVDRRAGFVNEARDKRNR